MICKVKRGRLEFYRSVRVGDRVVQRYVASGRTGAMIAVLDDEEAWQKKRQANQRRRDEADQRPLIEWSRTMQGVARQALEAAGFHQHKRGEWRRARTMTSAIQSARQTRLPAPMTPELKAIEQRWKDGDLTITSTEATALLAARPSLDNAIGSPARTLFAGLVNKYVGLENKLMYQATINRFTEMEVELAGPQPSALDRLMAEHAALCWLELNFLQTNAQFSNASLTIKQAESQQKQFDAVQKRFLAAVKTLALVRKLRLPDVMVNIDARQVHINSPA